MSSIDFEQDKTKDLASADNAGELSTQVVRLQSLEDQIKDLGWDFDPLEGLKIMKGEMDYYYDSDKEIQESELKIQYLNTLIDTLKEIVNNLNWRHQTIGNMIRWKVFEAGG